MREMITNQVKRCEMEEVKQMKRVWFHVFFNAQRSMLLWARVLDCNWDGRVLGRWGDMVVGWYGGGVVGWWGGTVVGWYGGGLVGWSVVGPKDGVSVLRVQSFNEREESA